MAYQTSGSSLLNDIMPQVKQWRATTGRDMSSSVIEGLLRAKIKADNDAAARARALDIQQQSNLANQNIAQQNLDLNKRKQNVSEITSAGSLLGVGAQGYKTLMAPAAAKTAVTPAASVVTGTGTDAAGASYLTAGEAASEVAPVAADAAVGATATEGAGVAGAGATAGAAPTAGAATAEIAASEAAAGASAESAGAGLLGSAAAYTGVGAAGLLGGKGGEYLADKWLGGLGVGGQQEKKTGGAIVGGAAMGAVAGTYVWPGVGTVVGGVIGAVVGGISSLF